MAGDVDRVPVHIKEPGTLKLGRDEATTMKSIITGTVAVDLPSAATGVAVSASAAVAAIRTTHNLFIQAQAWATLEEVIPIAAACLADGVMTVTGINAGSATRNATSQTFGFFAVEV